jgi:hypothetical protein
LFWPQAERNTPGAFRGLAETEGRCSLEGRALEEIGDGIVEAAEWRGEQRFSCEHVEQRPQQAVSLKW